MRHVDYLVKLLPVEPHTLDIVIRTITTIVEGNIRHRHCRIGRITLKEQA